MAPMELSFHWRRYYKQRFDRYATVDPRVQALLQYCGTEIFVDKAWQLDVWRRAVRWCWTWAATQAHGSTAYERRIDV